MIIPLGMPHISAVARLHIKLDPTSLFAGLGAEFREKIFYKEIVNSSDTFGFVYLAAGAPVGYISCCLDSGVFFKRIKTQYRWPLAGMYLRYLIKFPVAALRYLRLFFTLNTSYFDRSIKAEAVSFGVDPDYRSPEYYKKTSVNISQLLFNAVLEELDKRGVNAIRFFVADDNVLANIFYRNSGLRPVKKLNLLGARQTIYVADVRALLKKKRGLNNNA